jgi:pyridoxal phosphate enzyme (YggS family)
MQSVTQITDHLAQLRDRVRVSLDAAERAIDEVMIVAVSKQRSVALIAEAYAAGQRHFGENYVQEALDKMRELRHLPIQWHFIGRVQTNKTRPIAENFHWVHTVDRLQVARRLNAQRPHHAQPLNVLIQVNRAAEPQKAGIAPQDVHALALAILELPALELRGLMSIPPEHASPDVARAEFRAMRALHDELVAKGIPLDTLSMGMSADFEIAIAEGATCIRVGTVLFGERAARQAPKSNISDGIDNG